MRRPPRAPRGRSRGRIPSRCRDGRFAFTPIMDHWPFDQPKNCGTILSRAVLEGRKAITFVSHDEDDHAWQFLDDDTVEPEQAALVCLSAVPQIDPSVLEIADLEPGWIATRTDINAPWVRQPNPEGPERE